MRKRVMSAAFIMSVTMGMSLLAGCGSTTSDSSSGQDDLVYGVVEEVSDQSITIKEGTLNEDSEEDADSIIDVGDTEITIKYDDDTEVSFDGKGGPGGQPGQSGQGQSEQPPQPPEGQSGQGQSEQPSQPSEGQTGQTDQNQTDQSKDQPENAEKGGPAMSASNLKEGDVISVSLDEEGNADEIKILQGNMQGGPGNGAPGQGGGQSQAPESYTAVETISEDTETNKEIYESTGKDESAVLVDSGATATIKQATVTRKSDDSSGGDSASFYGVGAAVLNTEGILHLNDSTVDTDSAGGAGVFSYGEKAVTYVADTTIHTLQDTSGGIHVAGGGTLYASNVTAVTEGASSAAIRSDRGGGTMVVDGGSYTSKGSGSPAVYCTADITVNEADLTAEGSEAVCIEGLNTLRLYDSKLTGNMPEDSQNDCTWNVILYQSMSGDSQEGNSTFEMNGGSLTAKNGGMFYTTNTESTFILKDVDIQYAEDSSFFLKCTGNSNQRGWGQSGANGADSTFTAISQEMEGDIIWDSISQLDFYMTEGSSLTGAVKDDESNAGSGGDGYCSLYISEDSTWTVTGDSSLTNLYCQGKITDAEGKTVTVKGSDGTVYVKGDSQYIVTVESYSDQADLSGAGQASSYDGSSL